MQKVLRSDGSLDLLVKSLGSSNQKTTTAMSSTFNRKAGHIHLCMESGYCSVTEGIALHVQELELHDSSDLSIDFVGASGKRMLKQVLEGLEEEALEPPLPAREEEKEKERYSPEVLTPEEARRVGKGRGAGFPPEPPPEPVLPGEPNPSRGVTLRERLEVLKQKELQGRTTEVPVQSAAPVPPQAGQDERSTGRSGYKRAYFAYLDGELEQESSGESVGTSSGGQHNRPGRQPPGRNGRTCLAWRAEEERKEEEEKEKGWEKEEKEEALSERPRRWGLGRRKFIQLVQQSRVKQLKCQRRKLREWIPLSSQEEIRASTRIGASVALKPDRGEPGRASRRRHERGFSARRHEGSFVLPFAAQGKRHGAKQQRRKRIISLISGPGHAPTWHVGSSRRRFSGSIPEHSTSGPGRPLGSCEISRNSHAGDEHRSWRRPDPSRSSTCQGDRKSSRCGSLEEQRRKWPQLLGQQRSWRLALEFARGRRQGQRQEGQSRKRQRRDLEWKDKGKLDQACREGEGQEDRGVEVSRHGVLTAEGVSPPPEITEAAESMRICDILLEECQSLAELGVGLWYAFLHDRGEAKTFSDWVQMTPPRGGGRSFAKAFERVEKNGRSFRYPPSGGVCLLSSPMVVG